MGNVRLVGVLAVHSSSREDLPSDSFGDFTNVLSNRSYVGRGVPCASSDRREWKFRLELYWVRSSEPLYIELDRHLVSKEWMRL